MWRQNTPFYNTSCDTCNQVRRKLTTILFDENLAKLQIKTPDLVKLQIKTLAVPDKVDLQGGQPLLQRVPPTERYPTVLLQNQVH